MYHIRFGIASSLFIFFSLPNLVHSQSEDTTRFNLNEWRIILNDSVYDIDSNIYHTQKLGNQIWMIENLSVTRFNDGTEIKNINSPTVWSTTDQPAYFDIYGHKETNEKIDRHGILYNGYVAIDHQNVCPGGWHVPDTSDWNGLISFLDSLNYAWSLFYNLVIYIDENDTAAIDSLKNMHYNYPIDLWDEPYLFFSGDLNGARTGNDGTIHSYNSWAYWWCSGSLLYVSSWYGVQDRHWSLEQIYLEDGTLPFTRVNLNRGMAIRCIKDE